MSKKEESIKESRNNRIMKSKQNRWLLALAIISVFITAVEGVIYYLQTYSTFNFFILMMVIQNCFKAFLFTSAISISDVMKSLTADTLLIYKIIAYAYSISVFLAPACTLGVIVSVFESLMRKTIGKSKRRKKESIAIFGWNRTVQELLENPENVKDYSIRIFHSTSIQEEEHFNLLKMGVESEEVNLAKMKKEKLMKWFKKQKLDKDTKYLFLESDPFLNISLYMKLSDPAIEEINGKPLHCNVSCPNNILRQLIEDCTEQKQNIRLFNIKENAVTDMFASTPLYKGIRPNTNDAVHVLIIGLGDFGEEVLRQSVLLSTMNSTNPILIDVIDQDAYTKKDEVQSFFRKRMISYLAAENEIQISQDYCDGDLRIRFFNADATKSGLLSILDQASQNNRFTYAVISMGNTSGTLSALNQLVFYLEDMDFADQTPIQVYLPDKDEKTENLFDKIKRNKNVKEINLSAFSIKNILDDSREVKSACYNNLYDQIAARLQKQKTVQSLSTLKPEAEAITKWKNNEIKHYNKESSRWQQRHSLYKKYLLSELYKKQNSDQVGNPTTEQLEGFVRDLIRKDPYFAFEADNYSENGILYELLKTEHRRWNYYMLMRGWKVWDNDKKIDGSKDLEFKLHKDLICFDDLVERRNENKENSNDYLYDIVPYLLLDSD